MAYTSWLAAGLSIAVALPAGAQARAVNLKVAPLQAIEEPFTQIAGVRELPGNQAVVVDRGDQKIVLVNFSSGKIINVGRKGGGPGEFQFPMSIFAAPNNESWIADPVAGKVHIVSPDGKIPSAILPPTDEEGGVMMSMPTGLDAAGRLYFQGMPNFRDGGSIDSLNIIRWDRLAKRIDTLGTVPSGMTMNTSGSSGGNMQVMIGMKPWVSTPAWAPLPDGRIAIVQPNPYRVDFIALSKKVTQGPTQAYNPIKVTGTEREEYRAARRRAPGLMITRNTESSGSGTTSATTARNGSGPEIPDADFPAVMPPFSGTGSLQISPEGEIWVLRTRPASDKTPTYDIFDGNGRLVGKATLKTNSKVIGFGNGVVYVARQDPEDDLIYLEKYAR